MTSDDLFLIYSDNSAGYVRLGKKAVDGKYYRVGTSQAGGSSRYTYQNNFITADGNHAVLSGYNGLVIVSIDTVNETITQEVVCSMAHRVIALMVTSQLRFGRTRCTSVQKMIPALAIWS